MGGYRDVVGGGAAVIDDVERMTRRCSHCGESWLWRELPTDPHVCPVVRAVSTLRQYWGEPVLAYEGDAVTMTRPTLIWSLRPGLILPPEAQP